MELSQTAKEIHEIALSHGWWDDDRNPYEIMALIHSEVSEAVEEMRSRKPMFYISNGKPEGVCTELADVIIRILDFTEAKNCTGTLISAIQSKMEYNKTRPYRHGNKEA